MNTIHGQGRRLRNGTTKVIGALLMIAGTVLATAPALSATATSQTDGGCGEYSYGFTGTRLINDGISTSAGPFVIDLPAGTYDITLLSNDNHPSPTYQVEQTAEQWYFELDNGYRSTPTHDIPNDSENMVTSLSEVELSAATAITVRHLGEGGVNSVNVECIGFTLSDVAVLPPATTEAPAVIAPPLTDAPSVTAPTTAPAVVAPTTTEAVAAVPDTPVDTEVEGVVETPVPQLAVTGQNTNIALFSGIMLIGLGIALVSAASRPALR